MVLFLEGLYRWCLLPWKVQRRKIWWTFASLPPFSVGSLCHLKALKDNSQLLRIVETQESGNTICVHSLVGADAPILEAFSPWLKVNIIRACNVFIGNFWQGDFQSWNIQILHVRLCCRLLISVTIVVLKGVLILMAHINIIQIMINVITVPTMINSFWWCSLHTEYCNVDFERARGCSRGLGVSYFGNTSSSESCCIGLTGSVGGSATTARDSFSNWFDAWLDKMMSKQGMIDDSSLFTVSKTVHSSSLSWSYSLFVISSSASLG